MIKQEADDHVDALNEQIAAYRKIIDLKKELLRQGKEEEDYQKEVEKRLKEISRLQSRIDRLSLDSSREAAAERSKLEEELAEKQASLADYQADYAYNAQMDALDKEADKFEETKQDEIKAAQNAIDTSEKLYLAAIARIDAGWDQLYIDLLDWNSKYGDSINGPDSITSAWQAAKAAADEYGNTIAAIEGIKTQYGIQPDSAPYDYVSSYQNSKSESDVLRLVSKMKTNSQEWFNATDARREEMSRQNHAWADEISAIIGRKIMRGDDGVWYLDRIGGTRLYDIYHRGGVAGNNPTIKQNEIMALLEKGELVLDSEREKALYRIVDFTSELSERLGAALHSNGLSSMMFSPDNSGLRTLETLTNNTQENFSPTVIVQLSHNGEFSDRDADVYGRRVADAALDKFRDAFARRGIASSSLSALRP